MSTVVARALACAYPIERSWLKAVETDFAWITAHCDSFKAYAGHTLEQWACIARRTPRWLKGAVSKALSDEKMRDPSVWAVSPTKKPLSYIQRIVCDVCGEVMVGGQELAAHKFKAHGLKAEMRTRIQGNTCVACMHEFSGPYHLLRHVNYSAVRCRLVYTQLPKLDAVNQASVDEQIRLSVLEDTRAGRKPGASNAPPRRIPGPLTLLATRIGVGVRVTSRGLA